MSTFPFATQMSFSLPGWGEGFLEECAAVYPDDSTKMALAVALAGRNVDEGTGGPFGAAVFDEEDRLVSVGVNIVSVAHCSILHAEMVALSLAQHTLGRYDLSDGGTKAYTLASSTEPCAMCFGAIPWSGISRLVCGARDADARSIGFDEGPKPSQWEAALKARGIVTHTDVMRQDAAAVLRRYVEEGGELYNAHRTNAQHPDLQVDDRIPDKNDCDTHQQDLQNADNEHEMLKHGNS